MWRFAGRNAMVVGATLAALLLFMQLRAEGVDGYQFADVLSILLFAVPTALQRVRPSGHRRPRPRERAADGASDPMDTPSEPDAPTRPRTRAEERALVIERLAVYAVAVVIACGSYVLLVVLVLLQAWTPALSASLVFGIALAAISRHDATPQRPTAVPGDSA
jgi:hypothetical protein